MRLLALHARGRHAGPVACALLGVTASCWVLARVVRETGVLIPVLGPLAAVSVLGFALGAADPTLERVTPKHWTRWRAAELTTCALAAAASLLPTLAPADDHATEALRNLAGLGGLAALGVVALGARLAWVAPTAYAFAGAAVGPRTEGWLTPLTWPVQAGDIGLAFAAALALTGALLHVRYGAAGLDRA